MGGMSPSPDIASSPLDSEPRPGPAREAEITAQVVADLYERSRVAILLLLVLLSVIFWAMQPAYHADGRIRTLFVALAGVSVIRWLVAMAPAHRRDALASVPTQFLGFAIGVALTSCTLGAMVFLAWPHMDSARLAILAVITSGLVSGAIMSLGFSPIVYTLYWLPPVGVLFFRALTDTRPAWGADILATSFAIYGVAVLVISLDQRRARRQAIRLSLKLSDLVVRDALTKLHNRRFLQEFMPVETARMERDATDLASGRKPAPEAALALYMVDLDFFKQVNDTHGHAAGDAVLQQAARLLAASLRKQDKLVRWGGEEFVAVAWLKHREDGPLVAEKLRRALGDAEFLLPGGQVLRKTASIGFSLMPFLPADPKALSWEQALALADAALYLAKAEGRNRCVGVDGGPTPWPDVQANHAEAVADLRLGEAKGLLSLQRPLAVN